MAKHCSVRAQSWRMIFRSSPPLSPASPDHPIQIPPVFRSTGAMALASPPELRSVVQWPPAFRKVSGRRLETTTSLLVIIQVGTPGFYKKPPDSVQTPGHHVSVIGSLLDLPST